jgi:hypothetical protein
MKFEVGGLIFDLRSAAARFFKLDFCKMAIGPIFFKEISFSDFLEEST